MEKLSTVFCKKLILNRKKFVQTERIKMPSKTTLGEICPIRNP
jgi:hypothetical protein